MLLKFAALALLGLVQLQGFVEATSSPKTVCYYESWVHWRKGDGKIELEELDPTVCTHFVYAYMGIEAGTHEVKLLDPYLMLDLHDLDKFTKAKGHSKALISVGGASASTEFASTSRDAHSRELFVNSVVRLLSQHGFDGIIIDWYSMSEADGVNLIALLDKFDEKFASTPYTLAITLPVTEATLNYYNVPKIAQYVDFINVIAFDYNGPWGRTVDHASPVSKQLKTVEEYHKRGAPREKIVISIPTFARTWKLQDPTKQDIGAAASAAGTKGPYTDVDGLLSYNELCVLIKNNPTAFSILRDPNEMAVHAIYSHSGFTEWISYEDPKTLAAKAKNFTTMGFGGVSIYTLSNEDVHGVCGKKFPLLHALNDNYDRGTVTEPPHTTLAPVVHVTEPVHVIPGGPWHCTKVGKFRDQKYCFQYYDCQAGDFGTFEQVEMHCERHQAFDETTQTCVESNKVAGC